MDPQLASAVQNQIRDIVDQSDVKELADMLLPWMQEISWPNDRGSDLFDLLLQKVARGQPPDRALRVAFMLGAAWQKACDESEE